MTTGKEQMAGRQSEDKLRDVCEDNKPVLKHFVNTGNLQRNSSEWVDLI